jgi:hypothetical protein
MAIRPGKEPYITKITSTQPQKKQKTYGKMAKDQHMHTCLIKIQEMPKKMLDSLPDSESTKSFQQVLN